MVDLDLLLDEVVTEITTGASAGNSSIWHPDPRNEPQCLAYELARSGAVMEMGFGGMAGGGKTDMLLGIAATLFHRSRIMRREFPQLDGIIERGNEVYPTLFIAGSKKHWRFDRRVIALRSMQYAKNWKKYQGQAIEFLGIDEATEFGENSIRSVTGWIRSAEGVRTLVVYATNPPTTPEGEWIIRYFAPWLDPQYPNPAQDGEIRWFAHILDENNRETVIERPDGTPFEHRKKPVYPISRTFIHASRHDNPYLGEEYERRLQALPEPLRTIVMEGDFTVGAQDDPWQCIPTNWVLEAQKRWSETPQPEVSLRSLGVDVAHGGADDTVIQALYGVWFAEPKVYAGTATPDGDTAAKYVDEMWDKAAPIAVDAVGYGASAADTMRAWNMSPIPVNFGAGSDKLDQSRRFQFFNKRAECYWEFREALDPKSGQDICLPPSRRLRADLCAPRYKIVRGKIQIEEKVRIKERLGRSPDEGDAIVLCWYAGANRVVVPIDLSWDYPIPKEDRGKPAPWSLDW